MRHIVLFVCLTLCRFASLLGGVLFRGRFRRSTKRSMVGQVHGRFDAIQHAHFGLRSSHFFFRCRHVRQPVFVRNDACEVGDDFIIEWDMRTLVRIRSVPMSCLRLMHATCSMHVICSAGRIAEDELPTDKTRLFCLAPCYRAGNLGLWSAGKMSGAISYNWFHLGYLIIRTGSIAQLGDWREGTTS
jgi:hypothetical protein